jgi:hypothetical protein
MLTRFVFPVLLSITGLLLVAIPFIPGTHVSEEKSTIAYTGSNTFSCNFNSAILEVDSIQTEVSHRGDLFYLKIQLDANHENQISFVLKNEDIYEKAYTLDHPDKRYLSFLYHGYDCTYSSDEFYSGMLMIHKYDTINKIIAGSFEFMAHSDACDELVRVTNGTFDSSYISN